MEVETDNMSATDQMRMMINQLMGTDPQAQNSEDRIVFSDHKVCRSFLMGCCPHEVLASTRMDLGECPKVHNVALRADYEKAKSDGKDYFYDVDALDHLERFFEDCDRKTEINRKRLEDTQEELSTEIQEKADKVLLLNEDIGKTLAEAERLGSEGKVDESLKLMEKVEELRKLKQEADQEYRGSMPASSYQQQKLRVCEVCSAYLGIHDNDRRLADHFGGKLHMGFVFLRERLAELRSTGSERRAQRQAFSRENRGGYSNSRYSDRDRRSRDDDYDDRRRRRSRSRERSRGGSRHRSRSRDRDRDRKRSSRDKDRDRDRSDRDKDRDRDKERDRHQKSKKQKRSSRSKSRSREKSEGKDSVESGERASNGKQDVRLSDVDD